jgi:hypothetical protein
MRKLYFTWIVSCLLCATLHAQVRVGPFLAYGSNSELWGLGVNAEIMLNERFTVSPVFTQYFPKDFSNAPRRSMREVNANVNYYMIRGEVGYLYGLAGLNYTHIHRRNGAALTDDDKNDENAGINVGLGTMVRATDLLLPFVEAKYTAGGYSQLSVMFGVKFDLGDKTLEEDY